MNMCECKGEGKSVQLQVVKTYFDNGQKWYEYTKNEQGQKHGTFKRWYKNGLVHEHLEYVNGKLHGTLKRWYDNGHLWEHCEYLNNTVCGLYQRNNDNGSIIQIKQYINNLVLVQVNFTDANGNKLKKPILTITEPNHANIGVGLIQVIKLLQEKDIKFKIAKIGE